MGGEAGSCLYDGEVMHRRAAPYHRLRYRVFSLLLDLDEVAALSARLRWFSHNRVNLLSFYDRDHGACDGTPPRAWVDAALAAHGLETGGRIQLLCFPRLLGYVFNPLSIFFCYAPSGHLNAILYEVRNTFGDKHGYLIEVPADHDAEQVIDQACEKAFHVSPFLALAGSYEFRLKEPGDKLTILIRHVADGAELMRASHVARRAPLTDGQILRQLIRHPLMTLKVIAGIHWEALFLWIKGARFYGRPTPPATDVSFVPAPPPVPGRDLSNAA
jgi:DUF1365 family protein